MNIHILGSVISQTLIIYTLFYPLIVAMAVQIVVFFWRESAFFISFYIYSFKKTVSFCGVVFFFHFFLQNYMHIMILLLSSSSPFYNLNDSDQQIILRLTEGCNHFYHCYPHVIGCTQDTK